MPVDRERELIARTPGYEFRSAGKLCTVCGVVVGNVKGDDWIHEQWHAALAALLAGPGAVTDPDPGPAPGRSG